MDRVSDFKESRYPQPIYAAEECYGFVMLNFDSSAKSFASQYPQLTAMLNDVDAGSARLFAQLSYPSDWNWKVMVENFAESYHVSAFHPKPLQPIWSTQSSFLAETDEGFIHLKHTNDPKLGTLDVFVIPPYFMFAIQRPNNVLIWYDLTLQSVDHFELNVKLLTPKTHKVRFWEKFILKKHTDMVHSEDIAACQSVQRGLKARAAATGPLSTFERTITKFQLFWSRQMANIQ